MFSNNILRNLQLQRYIIPVYENIVVADMSILTCDSEILRKVSIFLGTYINVISIKVQGT